MHFLWAWHIELRHGGQMFVFQFHLSQPHLLSPLYLYKGCVQTMCPFRVHTSRVSTTPQHDFCRQPFPWGQFIFSVGRAGASVPFLWLCAPSAVVPVQNLQ